MTNNAILAAIVVAMLVTWVPRIFPYVLVRFATLPDKVVTFLGYLPLTIIFALVLSSIFAEEVGRLPQIKWIETLAIFPTFWVVLRTKNIMFAVVVGVACVAILRLLF